MASNMNIKHYSPMVEDYGVEAFNKGVEVMTEHYRAKLFMLKQQQDAEYKKHQAEREVSRIQGKLELINDLFKNDALREEKEKLESELVLAEAKAADVYVPKIDWFMLKEPQMFGWSRGFLNLFKNKMFHVFYILVMILWTHFLVFKTWLVVTQKTYYVIS